MDLSKYGSYYFENRDAATDIFSETHISVCLSTCKNLLSEYLRI
jgi:hypothetical protein